MPLCHQLSIYRVLYTQIMQQGFAGGDSSWERVSRLSDSGEEAPSPADDYAALTAQLAASGPAGGTRARTKRPASAVSTHLTAFAHAFKAFSACTHSLVLEDCITF